MLEPPLATMFCFVASDAAVVSGALALVLRRAVDRSFKSTTVDSDQSTSDTDAVLTTGLAENTPLETGSRGIRQFALGLDAVMTKLARMLVADGGGAQKLVSGGGRRARGGEREGRADRRAGRGQLSPGQDGDQRPGPQLGPHHDGPGQVAGP